MASTEGDSSASYYQVLLSQLPVQKLSTDNSTDWVPSCWPFHTNLLVFSSQADFLLTTELSHSPTSYFTSLHSPELLTDLTAARLVSSLYNLGADPTENTASNNPSIVVMGSWLAIDWISFPRERSHRQLLRNRCLFIRLLLSNRCTRCPFRGLCPATGLHATILIFVCMVLKLCDAYRSGVCKNYGNA
jgi:hypothetical protein